MTRRTFKTGDTFLNEDGDTLTIVRTGYPRHTVKDSRSDRVDMVTSKALDAEIKTRRMEKVTAGNTQASEIIDELVYSSYVAGRKRSPEITPEQWRRVYGDTGEMEKRYQQS